MRLRLSIRVLMAVVVLVAVVFAAWQGATELWANIIFNLIVLSLLFAAFQARYARGTAGAWWFGFALCGGTYLVLAIATRAVNRTETYLETPADILLRKTMEFMGQELLGEPPNRAGVTSSSRYLILKSLLTFPNALVGAAIFRFLAARRGASDEPGARDELSGAACPEAR